MRPSIERRRRRGAQPNTRCRPPAGGHGEPPVKCPKCDYLGFETGDRCKNCGYDFSLVSVVESAAADYDIHPAAVDDVPVHVIDDMEPTPDTRDDIVGAVDDRLTIS